MTEAQRNALLWLAGEDVPAWYDSARLNTLQALERRGLVAWRSDGPRAYWVKPLNSFLDHWYPGLTDEGELAANHLIAIGRHAAPTELGVAAHPDPGA